MGKRKSKILRNAYIHKLAIVSKSARIGEGTRIWAFSQIGDNARIGKNCVIANGVYIDRNVVVGDNVKIHNKALLYDSLVVEDNCFIGPGVCFTNDKYPRFNTRRDLKGATQRMKKGASVGANATILPDVIIGSNTIIGAGAVVTKSVPGGVIVCGNPARIIGRQGKREK